jgi:hypothetical protein
MTADHAWSAGERARVEETLSRRDDRQAFMRKLNDAVRRFADPARILEETCRLLGTHLRVNRVAYGRRLRFAPVCFGFLDPLSGLLSSVPLRSRAMCLSVSHSPRVVGYLTSPWTRKRPVELGFGATSGATREINGEN